MVKMGVSRQNQLDCPSSILRSLLNQRRLIHGINDHRFFGFRIRRRCSSVLRQCPESGFGFQQP